MKQSIRDIYLHNKPNLSNSSLTTYISIINNLHDKIFKEPFNIENFNNYKKVLNFLNNYKPNNRKTYISAIISLLGKENPIINNYIDIMIKDSEISNMEDMKQIKNDKMKQPNKQINNEEINNIHNELYNKVNKIIKINKNEKLNNNDYLTYQKFIILSLYHYQPPRRIKDFSLMKIKGNIDKDNDNYKIKNYFFFNDYKTKKYLGTQKIEIDKDLLKLLDKFIKYNDKFYNDNEFLLFNKNNKNYSQSHFTQLLNQIFNNKNISVNELRHLYLTSKYNNVNLDDIVKDAQNMGQSNIKTTLKYVKN